MTRVVLASPCPRLPSSTESASVARSSSRRAATCALQRPHPPAHAGGRHRARRKQRGHAPPARGARGNRRPRAAADRRGARRRLGARAGFGTEMVSAAEARRTHRALGRRAGALGLVVVDPVGRVGQALDPVEVGHVLVVRLGELGAEVAIALPPDDQGGRRDGAKLVLLRRQPHRGAVVVDHRLRRPGLGPRLDVAIDLLLRVRRAGVAQEALEEPPVPAARRRSGSLGNWK